MRYIRKIINRLRPTKTTDKTLHKDAIVSNFFANYHYGNDILERTELYLRDHKYKTSVFFEEMDMKKTKD